MQILLYPVLRPFRIIKIDLTFLTLNLISHYILKIYTNIIKFKLLLKKLLIKQATTKKTNILRKEDEWLNLR